MTDNNELRTHLENARVERKMPGFSAGVTAGGAPFFNEGFGFADVATSRAVTPDTIFGIGSLTKSFTAVAIMQLVDRGALHVSDRIVEYLPALAGSNTLGMEDVTLHHLLTNTSGLPPLPWLSQALTRSVLADPAFDLLGMNRADYSAYLATTDELIDAVAASGVKLLRPPGTIFSYSNDGFSMLGRIVEVVSGEGYEEFVTKNVLEPLGMTRSVFDKDVLPQLGDVTELYSYIGGFERVEHTPGWWEAPAMTSAGFLKSTANDMLRYGDLFLGKHPEVLSPASLEALSTPHARTGPGRYYGYGVMVQPDYHGHRIVEHGGNIKGVGAWLTTLSGVDVVSVILSNLTGGPVGELVMAGVNAAIGAPLSEARVPFPATVDLEPASRAAMAGVFVSAEGTEVEAYERDDGGIGIRIGKEHLELPTRAVGQAALVVDSNGQEAYVEFLDEQGGKFAALSFGFRVLERQG